MTRAAASMRALGLGIAMNLVVQIDDATSSGEGLGTRGFPISAIGPDWAVSLPAMMVNLAFIALFALLGYRYRPQAMARATSLPVLLVVAGMAVVSPVVTTWLPWGLLFISALFFSIWSVLMPLVFVAVLIAPLYALHRLGTPPKVVDPDAADRASGPRWLSTLSTLVIAVIIVNVAYGALSDVDTGKSIFHAATCVVLISFVALVASRVRGVDDHIGNG
jgi:hypothetical protein